MQNPNRIKCIWRQLDYTKIIVEGYTPALDEEIQGCWTKVDAFIKSYESSNLDASEVKSLSELKTTISNYKLLTNQLISLKRKTGTYVTSDRNKARDVGTNTLTLT